MIENLFLGDTTYPQTPSESKSEAPELYYMQDSRDYVGNDILFHAIDGRGYVTDLRKAQTFTKEVAMHMHAMRSTDIPWPKAYIDAKTRPAVDMQYVKLDEALEGTGIVIRKEIKKKIKNRCLECRSFVTAAWPYVACKRCGAQA